MKIFRVTALDGQIWEIKKVNMTLGDTGVDFINDNGDRIIIPWHQIKIIVVKSTSQ
jgi:hypothetical protein